MTNKFTLIGTGNNGFRHRYSIKKNEDFKKAFVKFMVDLFFEEEKLKKIFYASYHDKKGNEISKELKISEIEDVCWSYQNEKYDVDVFFGKFKVIIVVRTKKREPMINHLEKKAKWIKPLKVKKIKNKRIKSNKVSFSLQKVRNVLK